MQQYCISVFNNIEPGIIIPGFVAYFYFDLHEWEKMGERLDWLLDCKKPLFEVNKEVFFYLVGKAIENKYTFIVPDYFTGKASPQRFTITKVVKDGEK